MTPIMTPQEWLYKTYPTNECFVRPPIDLLMTEYSEYIYNEQTKWIPLSERLPLAYLSGDWDGLKSFPILAKDKDGKCFVAITYQGTMDGSEFCDWVDMNDCEIENIVSWQKIPD